MVNLAVTFGDMLMINDCQSFKAGIVDDALADERNKKSTIGELSRNSQKIKGKTA